MCNDPSASAQYRTGGISCPLSAWVQWLDGVWKCMKIAGALMCLLLPPLSLSLLCWCAAGVGWCAGLAACPACG